jgi:hypothetical protein
LSNGPELPEIVFRRDPGDVAGSEETTPVKKTSFLCGDLAASGDSPEKIGDMAEEFSRESFRPIVFLGESDPEIFSEGSPLGFFFGDDGNSTEKVLGDFSLACINLGENSASRS